MFLGAQVDLVNNEEYLEIVTAGGNLVLDFGLIVVEYNPSNDYLLKVTYDKSQGMVGWTGARYAILDSENDHYVDLELK